MTCPCFDNHTWDRIESTAIGPTMHRLGRCSEQRDQTGYGWHERSCEPAATVRARVVLFRVSSKQRANTSHGEASAWGPSPPTSLRLYGEADAP